MATWFGAVPGRIFLSTPRHQHQTPQPSGTFTCSGHGRRPIELLANGTLLSDVWLGEAV